MTVGSGNGKFLHRLIDDFPVITTATQKIFLATNANCNSSLNRSSQVQQNRCCESESNFALRTARVLSFGIVLVADQGLPYRLISEILYTAGQAEYGKYRLLVLKK